MGGRHLKPGSLPCPWKASVFCGAPPQAPPAGPQPRHGFSLLSKRIGPVTPEMRAPQAPRAHLLYTYKYLCFMLIEIYTVNSIYT